MPDEISSDVPFVISCYECDRGEPESYEEAVQFGWTEIQHFPEGLSENFLGLCPECRREQEIEDAARRRRVSDHDHQRGGDSCPT